MLGLAPAKDAFAKHNFEQNPVPIRTIQDLLTEVDLDHKDKKYPFFLEILYVLIY